MHLGRENNRLCRLKLLAFSRQKRLPQSSGRNTVIVKQNITNRKRLRNIGVKGLNQKTVKTMDHVAEKGWVSEGDLKLFFGSTVKYSYPELSRVTRCAVVNGEGRRVKCDGPGG